MQSDEKTISALSAQAHNAEADKRTLQKKLAASERRVQDLEKRLVEQQTASDERVRSLTDQLSQEMAKVSDMMQQLVSYMMGKGDVTLAGTIHETVVAGIREEVPRHGLGKCKADASILSWIIYEHLVKHVTLGEIEAEMKSMGLNIPHSTLCHWIELAADRLEPLDEPLHQEIINSGDFHSDESTLQVLDVPVGTKENEEVRKQQSHRLHQRRPPPDPLRRQP